MRFSIKKASLAAGALLVLTAVPVALGSGGGGGGGTTITPCSTIVTLSPKVGYLPKGLDGAAVWVDTAFRSCSSGVRVTAVLGGRVTGGTELDPWTGADAVSMPRWNLGFTVAGSTATLKVPTIDQEPVPYDTSYDIWVSTYNADTWALIETKTVTVVTPAPKVRTVGA